MIYFQGQIDREVREVIAALEDYSPVFGNPSMPLTLECDGQRWFVIGQHPSPIEQRAIEEALHKFSSELREPLENVRRWLTQFYPKKGKAVVFDPPASEGDTRLGWTSISSPEHFLSCTLQRLENESERIAARLILEGTAQDFSSLGWDVQALEHIANDASYPARITI